MVFRKLDIFIKICYGPCADVEGTWPMNIDLVGHFFPCANCLMICFVTHCHQAGVLLLMALSMACVSSSTSEICSAGNLVLQYCFVGGPWWPSVLPILNFLWFLELQCAITMVWMEFGTECLGLVGGVIFSLVASRLALILSQAALDNVIGVPSFWCPLMCCNWIVHGSFVFKC